MLPKTLHPRRNPLTKDQERLKKLESAKHNKYVAETIVNQIYIWYWMEGEVQHVVYVGKAIDPPARFKEHLTAIKLGVDLSRKYENYRHFKHEIVMTVVDALGEFSESDWKQIYTDAGHDLWNDVDGITRKRHKPKKKLPPIDGSTVYHKRTYEEGEALWKRIKQTARDQTS